MKPIDNYQQIKVNRVIQALARNNMVGHFASDQASLLSIVSELVNDGDTVSVGGSMTLFESGVIEWLRQKSVTFLDRYAEGLTHTDIEDIYFKSFKSDVYFTSTNAITEDGVLYNVDGRGNRVAAMIYGPKMVIVIAGINKIVADEAAAIQRNRDTAAPLNAMRLARNTPCVHTGQCVDCQSDDRICSAYVFHRKQMVKDRIHVILCTDYYGY